ncbi:MAG TPA: methyltransferase domain-containing protein, partial [bacterium]
MSTEQRQKELFDSIFQKYADHYDDAASQRYRARFIYEPLFQGIDLAGCQVLEAMCGTGQTTQYLLDQKAVVTGLDISENAITYFGKRWPDCHAICASMLQSNLDHGSFDCVVIIGG